MPVAGSKRMIPGLSWKVPCTVWKMSPRVKVTWLCAGCSSKTSSCAYKHADPMSAVTRTATIFLQRVIKLLWSGSQQVPPEGHRSADPELCKARASDMHCEQTLKQVRLGVESAQRAFADPTTTVH